VPESVLGEPRRTIAEYVSDQVFVDDLLQWPDALFTCNVEVVNPSSNSRRRCFSASLATVFDLDFDDSMISRPEK
jgi:hypothetical protein